MDGPRLLATPLTATIIYTYSAGPRDAFPPVQSLVLTVQKPNEVIVVCEGRHLLKNGCTLEARFRVRLRFLEASLPRRILAWLAGHYSTAAELYRGRVVPRLVLLERAPVAYSKC